MYWSFPYFMACLRDDTDKPLMVDLHHEVWGELLMKELRLVLMAPRDHGKSWTLICYILWRAWRHNRDPLTGLLKEGNPDGVEECLLFSATLDQSLNLMDKLRAIVMANEDTFLDLMPPTNELGEMVTVSRGSRKVWSVRHIRFTNDFDLKSKSFRSSTRGLHPRLVVCDDVLDDRNSLTSYQRTKVWQYFLGTVQPMLPPGGQIVVIGTAFHYDDLLHRLGRTPGYKWYKFRAVDWTTNRVLWPQRHSLADLTEKREQDPIIFAREYQNDPRDDSSSLFPTTMTDPALEAGLNIGFETTYRKASNEFVLLSADIAQSEAVGADFTVIKVVVYDVVTGIRRLIFAERGKGWPYDKQVERIRRCYVAYGVDLGVVEENSMGFWVLQKAAALPDVGGRLVGHTTGVEKQDRREGVPLLTSVFRNRLWVIPTGTMEALEYAKVWQAEMQAFSWVDGKLQGVGEHDDTVMATWLMERAQRILVAMLNMPPKEETVTPAQVGIEDEELAVPLGSDY